MFNSVIHCGSAEATSHWQNKRRPDCQSDFLQAAQLNTETSYPFQTIRCHNLEMEGDIIGLVEPHIREILRICSAADLEGRELQELNALVGRTSKLIFIPSFPVR